MIEQLELAYYGNNISYGDVEFMTISERKFAYQWLVNTKKKEAAEREEEAQKMKARQSRR